jgi:predicted NUDIX family NTP pyrophosphohydrolase
MYRQTGHRLEVLLVHPGGPFWRNKDEGAWSIPKGEMAEGEDATVAARREFREETGCDLSGPLKPLGDIRQRGGKRVTAFAIEGDLDAATVKSNTFEIEWPPKSGKMQSFPEIDRAAWFDLAAAHVKILESQRLLLDRLADHVPSSHMTDPFDLQRFLDAQSAVYPRVLGELRRGRKQSHWMWFIFPQLAGLGFSAMAQRFAISSREEAVAYLRHDVLGARLKECTAFVNAVEGRTILEILGTPDDLKFRSSMTLFGTVSSEPEFAAAISKFYGGVPDQATLDLLAP